LIIDDLSKGKKDEMFLKLIEEPNVFFIEKDLSELDSYSEMDSDYDQIYHLAAIVGVKNVTENPVLTIKVNTLSTIYLLEYIRNLQKKPKLLFTSSCENYAGSLKHCNIDIPTPEDVVLCIEDVNNPRWTYASSKILGEIACLQYAKKYNFNSIIIRYHNIYGPRMGIQHVIPEFILRLKKKPKIFEMYGGYQYRSFCYVEDAAKMTINLMNNSNGNGKVVNVGGEDYLKISILAQKICKILDVSIEFIEKGAPEGSVEKRKPNLTFIKSLNSYVSDISLEVGLKYTCNWYQNHLEE